MSRNTLLNLTPYVEYNYGRDSGLAKACRANDEQTFLRLTANFTEMTDIRIVRAHDRLYSARGQVRS